MTKADVHPFHLLLLPLLASADHEDDHGHSHEYLHADWFARTSMPVARSDMTATVVSNGIYVVGGCAASQGWVSKEIYAGITGQSLNSADVQNWYEGYYCGSLTSAGATNRTSVFYPDTNVWAQLDDAPRPRYRHAAAVVGHLVYVFGGTNDDEAALDAVDVLDTNDGTWSTLPQTWSTTYRDLAGLYVACVSVCCSCCSYRSLPRSLPLSPLSVR